jgi:hypothetical protein
VTTYIWYRRAATRTARADRTRRTKGTIVTIVGVHGIWNHPYISKAGTAAAAIEAISQEWTGWLRTGLAADGHDGADTTVRVGYYAHHLHRGTAQGSDDVTLLEEDAQDLLISWVELLQPVPQVAQGPRTAKVRGAADWLTRRYGRAARGFAMVFVREVATYLKEPEGKRRLAARDAVADTIAEAIGTSAGEPVTVVAHSLGSVVAYEALWANPELRVDRLITLGSPLGMAGIVFPRLLPTPIKDRGCRPPGVATWTNLADIGDLVAIPRQGLGGCFDGVDIENPALTIANWDFHTVRSYLTCPDVAGHCV